MASGLTAKLLQDLGVKDIEVRSAGVLTVTGLLATAETLQMLKSVNVTLERHRSTPVSVELLRKCDLILGMTPLHVQHALRMAPDIRGRVFLFKEYTRSDLKKVQIDDPMGNTLEVYKKVFNEIRSACQKFLKTAYVTGETVSAADKKRKRIVAKTPAKKVKTVSAATGSAKLPAAHSKVAKVASAATAKVAKAVAPAAPKSSAKPVTASKSAKTLASSK